MKIIIIIIIIKIIVFPVFLIELPNAGPDLGIFLNSDPDPGLLNSDPVPRNFMK